MTEDRLAALGRRIRQAREEKKISRSRLANAVGVAKGTIDKWEIGWSHPSRDNMRSLSEALGVSEAFLRSGAASEVDETDMPQADTGNDDSDGVLVALLVKVASRLPEGRKREVVSGIELTLG